MKKIIFSVFISLSLLYLVSCKKDSGDNNPPSGNIQGNYQFLSLSASTTSTVIITDGTTVDKTVTKSDYTTKNNAGTMTITDSKIISTDLSYSIDTIAHSDMYENGVLVDNFEFPFQFDAPTSSATTDYVWVTSDSIYCPNGTMFTDGVTSNSGPSGARIMHQGDKLYIYASKEQTTHDNSSGYPTTMIAQASVIATYQKQ
jgi:hypothetical protein